MPVDFGVTVVGLVDEEGQEEFIAPLPTLGLRLNFALTPKWFIRMSTDYFYLEHKKFSGSLISTHNALEYKPWNHVGIGLALDTFKIWVESDGEDYPNVDFSGEVEFEYIGLQLYLRLYF
jgi:hypothetical protein